MDASGGSRLVRVHGAVTHLVRGHHGLIAGCSFAKDVLKTFLLPIANAPRLGKCLAYVDDITLSVEAHTLGEAAAALRSDLEEVECALRSENIHLNDAKEQVHGATLADRRAWEAQGSATVEVARGRRVSHRSRRTHPTLAATMRAQRSGATRLGCHDRARQHRVAMAVAAFCGKALLWLRDAVDHPPPDPAVAWTDRHLHWPHLGEKGGGPVPSPPPGRPVRAWRLPDPPQIEALGQGGPHFPPGTGTSATPFRTVADRSTL